MTDTLPSPFRDWFAARGWSPHPHQRALIDRARPGGAELLVAPTGAGKTLAGFLPSLIDLAAGGHDGLHTLYVSPLKALAADIRRNLSRPVDEMGLPIRVEDRTGDTRQSQRARQRRDPPHILLTTPESLALLLSQEDAPRLFAALKAVVVDEAHALAEGKRGDQLTLCLARLSTLAPAHRRVGLSATTEDPAALAEWLAPGPGACGIVRAADGPDPDIRILETAGDPPWSGSGGRYAARAVYEEIKRARTTLVFINTRALAELFFFALWDVNADGLPIALHHGSLGREARQKVEAAMAAGELRAVVCTSSLDLGIDWGDVDLVIQVGAPKGVKRLVQRIGRANHRFDAPSRAILVPANRLEVLECRAALEAARRGTLDGEPRPPGRLDVLCQHILLTACAGPFDADALFAETRGAGPYRALPRAEFDRCLEFCASGGYALRAYDRWKRLLQEPDGLWRLRDPRTARRLRMNVGTIVEAETLSVRAGSARGGGAKLGEVEEAFAATLRPGDTFLIGGQVVRFEGLREMSLQVTRASGKDPKIPVFAGGKLPISELLAERVIAMLNAPDSWGALPRPVSDWLRLQTRHSEMPRADDLLVETFPRAGRWFLAAWGFAGRNAHQTLGLLATKRMEALGLDPLGFLATDYAVLIWGLEPVDDPAPLFEAKGLRDGLEQWLYESSLMKRAFRQGAVVSGLIERRLPGQTKTGRQATFSSDILYDTLRKYDPDHLMLEITRREATRGLVDFDRIEALLARVGGRIRHVRARRVTPLAAPLLMEMGREKVAGGAEDRLLEEEAEALMAELSAA
jgi:ATP-dependent Lhr-like helicase